MLQIAQQNLAAFDNIVYQQSAGHILPLPDATLDAVFANMYLHHCPDPLAAIQEMVRVLKPGGRLVLTDMDAHDHAWLREEMADEWLGFARPQIRAWLREADLVNVIVTCASQCCADSQADAARLARIDVFVAAGTRRVAGAQAAVQANYGALAQGGGCCTPVAGPDVAVSEFVAEISLSSGSCCAPANAMPQATVSTDAMDWHTGYTPDQLAVIPAQAAELSLGCGNPGAIALLRPGEVVLDIGSGGGIDAFFAAQRVGSAGHVIGVDMTPPMIERAQRTANRVGIGNVEFRLGQATALPVTDGAVDVVMSNCVINLCEDKGRVFEEAYRVLKPGGRLAVSDIVTDGPLPAAVRGDPTGWAGCVSGALPEREYLALVAAAGFADVRAARSLSAGKIGDVAAYSLSVSASKR